MKKLRILLIIFFIGITQLSFSQKIDSLIQILATTTIDSLKLEINQAIGNQYYKLSEYDSANYFYHESYLLALKTQNKQKQAILQSKKATLLYWNSFNIEADSLFKESLKIALEIKDSSLITGIYNSLSSNYLQSSNTLLSIQSIEKALDFCPKQDKSMKGRTYANLGQLKRDLKELDEALHYFQLSEDIWKELEITAYIARIQFEKAKIYHLQKKHKKAIHFFRNSLAIDTVNTDKTIQAWKYKRLSDSYVAIGKFDSAYYFQKLHTSTHWEIFTLGKKIALKELNIKYETELKEHENSKLKYENRQQSDTIKNRNILNLISLIALVSILSFLVILIRGKKKILQKNKNLKAQKKEIKIQSEKLEENLQEIIHLTNFKENLTQMLVHDLKSPLNRLLNLPKSLSPIQKEEIQSYSARKMLNLVLNILNVSKYEKAELKIYPEETSISQLCQQVLVQENYLIKQKNIRVKNQGKYEYFVMADKELTGRILSNLLSNALQYTQNNGNINLTCEKTNNSFLKITLSDNGIGIPEADLSSIFKKYTQAGLKIKNSTGLGLTFCKIAVEKHGGKIGIKSEEDKGTTVWFTLPISNQKNAVQKKEILTKKIKLSKKEKQQLSEFITTFEDLDLSQITTFRKVFKEIESKYSINETWLQAFKNSVYHYNEEEYSSLVAMIIPDG